MKTLASVVFVSIAMAFQAGIAQSQEVTIDLFPFDKKGFVPEDRMNVTLYVRDKENLGKTTFYVMNDDVNETTCYWATQSGQLEEHVVASTVDCVPGVAAFVKGRDYIPDDERLEAEYLEPVEGLHLAIIHDPRTSAICYLTYGAPETLDISCAN